MERKQIALVIVLIIAVAGVSFTLGVMFGQRTRSGPALASDNPPPDPVAVTQAVPPPPPPSAEGGVEKQEKLTFYDNLPKGNQAPLGSGINLPPETEKPAVADKTKGPAKSSSAGSAPASNGKTPVVPAASSDGAFIVQIASFRSKADAGKLVQRLDRYQLKASVEAVDLGGKGVWHRVLAGPYPSRESADQVAGLLREKERLSALVRQR
jgi:cell division protein FtsN